MPILKTARNHFNEDLTRASNMLDHARPLQSGLLRDDILRATWMFSVGACDAYFSDAYADLIARTLRAKEKQSSISIPDRLNNLRVPVVAVIRKSTGGWRWRMAARELIEDENVLSLEKIRSLFNQFCNNNNKLVNNNTIGDWIVHKDAKVRMFGISGSDYKKLAGKRKESEKKKALIKFESRFKETFQRRHDCIHNCDRPKVRPQTITDKAVKKRIADIRFLVDRCEDALVDQFPKYLNDLGFSNTTISQVTK
ncbi:MAG: hypothetical protein AAFP18_11300 [Bacteroidota bacterium]